MEHKEGLAAEGTSISGRSEVVATRPEMSASAAIAQAIATYVEYVNDDFYLDLPCTQVGCNYLIVDNILRYCDKALIRKCTQVNHFWRNLSIPRSYLRIGDDEHAEQLLQRIGNLESFTSLKLECVHFPRNLISYSPNLVSLVLRKISFPRSADVYDIIFNSFPRLKNLKLWSITVEDQRIFPDFEIATPKLESLSVEDVNTFITSDFCLKVIGKLRNLKKLVIYLGKNSPSIPLFATLIKANIKLEYLDIGMYESRQESSAIINKYLRVCGEYLRHLELSFSVPSRPFAEILSGYSGKKLRYLYLYEKAGELTLRRNTKAVFKLSLEIEEVQNIPNISSVILCGTYVFSQPLPSIESPASGSLTVDDVTVTFKNSEYLVDEESRHARNVIFVLFPNVLSLELSAEALAPIYDFVKKAGIHWPHLRSLSINHYGPFNCEEWRNVIVHMVLNLKDLEDVSFYNWKTPFDSVAIVLLFSLPKLKCLHVQKLRIPDKLYHMMTDRVDKVTVDQLLIEDED